MQSPDNWERLGAYVRRRRTELRMTQKDVQDAGGPSAAKVREIENSRTTTLSTSKRRDLERALQWSRESVDKILAGLEPGSIGQPRKSAGVGAGAVIAEATSRAPQLGYFDALRHLHTSLESVTDAFQEHAYLVDLSEETATQTAQRLTSMRNTAIDLLVEEMTRNVERLREEKNDRERLWISTEQVMEVLGVASGDPNAPSDDPWWLDDKDALAEAYVQLTETWPSHEVQELIFPVAESLAVPARRPASLDHYNQLYLAIEDILVDRHGDIDEGEVDDIATESTSAGRSGEAPEGQKTRGRGSLPPRPSRHQIRSVGRRITSTRASLGKGRSLTPPNQPEDLDPPAYPPMDLPVAADSGGPKGIDSPPTEDEFSQDPDDHTGE
ncbi:helix-turn-helix transcriptional regulator [Gordonia sp. SCSIO 19800]|uniref:helix-turn-helix domain-containing protein n=1 Tax=Gordonia sp. SCSIO 19800 TaxID=2826926 RepID=UPI001B8447C8|nr:helix-turn-helix transcriptional regulator [Gordonia sp. SCSIO 19800]MBR7191680.1 helix-turn-helix domain-containing protein [Gordonia sp. SCSIO 19800]